MNNAKSISNTIKKKKDNIYSPENIHDLNTKIAYIKDQNNTIPINYRTHLENIKHNVLKRIAPKYEINRLYDSARKQNTDMAGLTYRDQSIKDREASKIGLGFRKQLREIDKQHQLALRKLK